MRERRDAKKFEAQSNPPISGESVAELKVDGIQPVVTLPKVPIFCALNSPLPCAADVIPVLLRPLSCLLEESRLQIASEATQVPIGASMCGLGMTPEANLLRLFQLNALRPAYLLTQSYSSGDDASVSRAVETREAFFFSWFACFCIVIVS